MPLRLPRFPGQLLQQGADGEKQTNFHSPPVCRQTIRASTPEELLSVRVQVSGVFAMRVMPETAMPRSSYCFSAR